VLPSQVPSVSLEAGVSHGWSRWVDASISIERFGASSPGAQALSRLGITPARVVECAKALLSG
jgi:transketolase